MPPRLALSEGAATGCPFLTQNQSLDTAPGALQSEVADGNGCACAVQLEAAQAELAELQGRGEEAAAQLAQQAADSHGRLAEAAAEVVQARQQACFRPRSAHANLAASQRHNFGSARRAQGSWSKLGGRTGLRNFAA